MGLVSLFNSVVNFVYQSTNLGVSFTAVRHLSELFDQGDEKRISHFVKVIRSWSLLTALMGMLVCVMVGPILSRYSFLWGDHTLHFVFLSPAIGLMAFTGGEMAILKASRQLRSLAVIQVYLVFLSLLISVPLYYFFWQAAIVPVIVLMMFASMLLTIRYSFRLYPFHLSGEKGILGDGMEMVRLGVAFTLAGIFSTGAEMLVRSYLNVVADLDVVGFYNAGFVMTVTYASMVFSAMETDYFPRLSSISNDVERQNLTINRQIEVSLLIVSPMLCALIVYLPVLIPLLYTNEFISVVGMTRVAVFAMYMKAVSMPMSYLLLARGASISFLIIEGSEALLLVLLMVIGFNVLGLVGTGAALVFYYLIDIIIVFTYVNLRYNYRVTSSIVTYFTIHLLLGISAYCLSYIDNQYVYWIGGSVLFFLSLSFSVYVLYRRTSLWGALVEKMKSKLLNKSQSI